jgi:hypothetical protein
MWCRQDSRRIVRRFVDWIESACKELEREAQQHLASVECAFRLEEDSGLMSAVWELGASR